MDKPRVFRTYYVEFDSMKITRLTDMRADLTMRIYPERCFDSGYLAQYALRKHYKNLRDIAQQQVKKAFLVTITNENT